MSRRAERAAPRAAATVTRAAPRSAAPALGIVGGLGPLASAEFLKTIYEESPHAIEQDAPACVLVSDPAMPDRTEAILRGQEEVVVRRLEAALETVLGLGAGRAVIVCMTMHHFLAAVAEPLRRRVVSLVEIVLDEVIASGGRWLLLTSTGTRHARVLERSDRWRAAEPHLVWPDALRQVEIHAAIYRMKRNHGVAAAAELVGRLVAAHGADGFVAGCTEFHLVTKHLSRQGGASAIDPLLLVARRLPALVAR